MNTIHGEYIRWSLVTMIHVILKCFGSEAEFIGELGGGKSGEDLN